MEFGYARVSSRDQNEERQLLSLKRQGVEPGRIYVDKQSGKNFDRPQYQRLLRVLRSGDVLHVASLDRLGRDYKDVIEQWRILTKERHVDINVLDMPLLDTRKSKNLLGTFIADLVLQVLSFVAQNERENIRKRQAEGIAAALARGVKFGRREQPVPDSFAECCRLWEAGLVSVSEGARKCSMKTSTFYFKARTQLARRMEAYNGSEA